MAKSGSPMEKPVRIKSIRGEDGPEAEERLYQLLLFLVQIAAEGGASEALRETKDRGTPSARA